MVKSQGQIGVRGQKLNWPGKNFILQLWIFAGHCAWHSDEYRTYCTVSTLRHISLRRPPVLLPKWLLTPGCLRPRPSPGASLLCTPHPQCTQSWTHTARLVLPAEDERTRVELGDDIVGLPSSYRTGLKTPEALGRPIKWCPGG